MLTPAAAEAAIAASLARLPEESCALPAAAGRVLREELAAERDQPPFDRVAMDGIAVTTSSWLAGRRRFQIAGTVPAGTAPLPLEDPEACLEVMTGAVLPPGADAVLPYEWLTLADGTATVAAGHAFAVGANIHRRGVDAAAGSRVLGAGTRLRGPELAIAAASGRATLKVSREPRIAVVSSGDELVAPGLPISAWQVRRSNVYGISAALEAHGWRLRSDDHVRDDRDEIRATLARLLANADVVILSGGVSAGRFDYIPEVLVGLDVKCVFHQVAQRPGKPLWFGVGPAGQAVFALPGNPVSTLVCLYRYVLPALERLCGATPLAAPLAPLGVRWAERHGLTAFLPVDRAAAAVVPHPTHGSGDFTALAGTAGFVELGPERSWEPGDPAPLYLW